MSTTSYIVRAPYRDYETGNHTLRRSFDTLAEAEAFRDRINAHMLYHRLKVGAGGELYESQGEVETDEAFAAREAAHQAREEAHRDEQMEWFDMGHGYFQQAPTISRREETVLS